MSKRRKPKPVPIKERVRIFARIPYFYDSMTMMLNDLSNLVLLAYYQGAIDAARSARVKPTKKRRRKVR